jgi:hypothetical protein
MTETESYKSRSCDLLAEYGFYLYNRFSIRTRTKYPSHILNTDPNPELSITDVTHETWISLDNSPYCACQYSMDHKLFAITTSRPSDLTSDIRIGMVLDPMNTTKVPLHTVPHRKSELSKCSMEVQCSYSRPT